ncbi:MAG: hypothetical protein KatS3mg108_0515 [Isosphaeraceae bacterium]|jgi:hypothetical protein|nr:MAG: hypothetical protein KatS3mg108_0515 [Isosphaeraceae bacterium]
MKTRSRFTRPPTWVASSFALAWWLTSQPALAQTVDRDALRSELKLLWDSLSSLEFHCEDVSLAADGEIDRSVGSNHFDFAWTSAGNRSLKIWAVKPSNEMKLIGWETRDSHRSYSINTFHDDLEAISQVFIDALPPPGDPDRGATVSPLWMLMPQGIPLYQHLDRGPSVKLELVNGKCVVELTGKRNIRLTLDPEHDWLASRVEFASGSSLTVRRFGRDNGRWFPVEILLDDPNAEQYPQSLSLVTELRINRPIAPSKLTLPELPDGVYVEDRIAGHSAFRGGAEARERLESRHTAPVRTDVRSERPVVAASSPSGLPWPGIVASVSLALIGAGGLLAWRRSASDR